MKKTILTSLCALALSFLNAQIITDTVSIGAGYSNQTWYSLQNGVQGTEFKNNWDIAFAVGGYETSIHINSITGTMLWTYPHGDTSAWNNIDTTGINSWIPQYNSDTTWAIGAFDKGKVSSNPNDVGWGIYNFITHVVTGDSLFVIKLSNGTYKKLWIKNLAGGGYNFQYADLDGANLQTHFLPKSSYAGKNFGYFSLQTNTAIDREPVPSAGWDLLFTQYTAFVPSPYTVAGVLSNKGVEVAQVNNVDQNTYNNWPSHTFTTAINEIGYDWKTFSSSWVIQDSLVYFIKSKSGDIWKLVFNGFGGSVNGNYIFTKEKLSTVGLEDLSGVSPATISLYPNPASNSGSVTLIYNFENNFHNAQLNIYDLSGKVVSNERLNNNSGFNTHTIQTANLKSGMYIVSVELDGLRIQQKLIIR